MIQPEDKIVSGDDGCEQRGSKVGVSNMLTWKSRQVGKNIALHNGGNMMVIDGTGGVVVLALAVHLLDLVVALVVVVLVLVLLVLSLAPVVVLLTLGLALALVIQVVWCRLWCRWWWWWWG